MQTAVQATFPQHPTLRAQPLATGDVWLVEHSPSEAYRGDGGDGRLSGIFGEIIQSFAFFLRCYRKALYNQLLAQPISWQMTAMGSPAR
jgi:hypothetical protein